MVDFKKRKRITEEFLGREVDPKLLVTKEDYNDLWDELGEEEFYKQAEFFIQQGCFYGFQNSRIKEGMQLESYANYNKLKTFVDVGAGCGIHAEYLSSKGFNVDVVEYDNSKTLAFLKKYFEDNDKVNVLSWSEFSQDTKTYDILYAFDIIEHFDDVEGIIDLFRTKAKVLIEETHLYDNDYAMHYGKSYNISVILKQYYKLDKQLDKRRFAWRQKDAN